MAYFSAFFPSHKNVVPSCVLFISPWNLMISSRILSDMLKLEKTSNAAGLALRMREKERFLEPRVIKALAIALGLHIGGLVLFHAAPFDFSSSYLFPPIQVQMDSLGQGVSVSLSPSSEKRTILPSSNCIDPDNGLGPFSDGIFAGSRTKSGY